MRVTAILACHNRRALTVRCLRSLFAVTIPGIEVSAVVADDGSTDGTSDAVRSLKRPITVLSGPGDWFWSRGMAEAERVAELTDPDWILWLNDDVELTPQGILRLVAAIRREPEAILVGALRSDRKDQTVYAGFSWPDPDDVTLVRLVKPGADLVPIDGFHGNVVAVPRSARRRIGPIDGRWPHHYGDLDYARRAAAAGVDRFLVPGTVGVCEPEWAAEQNPAHSRAARVAAALGRRGWPVRAQIRFGLRHGSPQWWRKAHLPYSRSWRGWHSD